MSDFQRLSKAPIILSVLEVKFAPPDSMTIKDLAGLKVIFKEDFPVQVERNQAQFQFNPSSKTVPVNVQQDAYVFTSTSKKHEILITTDSFSFLQHGSYDTWAAFKKVGLGAWIKCESFIKPTSIDRLSVRYVNSVELPYPPNTVQTQEKFFKTTIVGPTTGKPIQQYSMRFTHPAGDDGIMVHFAQDLKPGVSGLFPFIIDIDVLYFNNNTVLRSARLIRLFRRRCHPSVIVSTSFTNSSEERVSRSFGKFSRFVKNDQKR